MGFFTDGAVAAWARQAQRRRRREERRLAARAEEDQEALTHERRAQKAGYLSEKLDEQARSQPPGDAT